MNILFERADRNKEKYRKSLEELSRIAMAKMGWCLMVVCEFNQRYALIIKGKDDECITVDAMDFFERYEREKRVSKEQLLKCDRL